jgi:hypothetical protein
MTVAELEPQIGPAAHGRRAWTEQDLEDVKKLLANGVPAKKIAYMAGITTAALYTRLHMAGISIREVKQEPKTAAAPVPVPEPAPAPTPAPAPVPAKPKDWNYGGADREHGSTQRRFVAYHTDPADVVPLKPESDAIQNGRSVFYRGVKSARETERLLISGHNNPKIGAKVEKGAWAGMPIYTLTLEERATCPRYCPTYFVCYGNAMHLARRHAHGDDFERRLELEVKMMGYHHPQGFVVRLHVLGDFYSVGYVRLWAHLIDEVPELHVYGYTARDPHHPDENEAAIGLAIRRLKWAASDRFRIRWSRKSSIPDGATVINYRPESKRVPEGLVCPAQSEDTACCATCALCWSERTKAETIVFIQHGMTRREKERV